jgi:hypothetical protein
LSNAARDHAAEQLIETGGDLAAWVTGAAVGALGGPVFAMVGAALGVAGSRVAQILAGRFSRREEERIGATLAIIVEDTAGRDNGRVRDDGFFEEKGDVRSDGEEVLEAVLRQAAASYEERKLPYLAHLYANIARSTNISRATAIWLVRKAEPLTYRQMTALAIAELDIGKGGVRLSPEELLANSQIHLPTTVTDIVLDPERKAKDREEHAREELRRSLARDAIIAEGTDSRDNPILTTEEAALVDAGLLVAREPNPNSTYVMLGESLHPRAEGILTPTPLGALLTHLMGLRLIPDDEFRTYIAETRGQFR